MNLFKRILRATGVIGREVKRQRAEVEYEKALAEHDQLFLKRVTNPHHPSQLHVEYERGRRALAQKYLFRNE